jgi:uncharacterized membrane protein
LFIDSYRIYYPVALNNRGFQGVDVTKTQIAPAYHSSKAGGVPGSRGSRGSRGAGGDVNASMLMRYKHL